MNDAHARGQPRPQEEVLCLEGRRIVRISDLQLDGGVDRTRRRKGAAITLVCANGNRLGVNLYACKTDALE